GEYPFLNDIAINNSGNLELLCAMGFVYEYDLSGKYIKTTKISSSYIRAVHGLISLDKHTRVFFAAFHHPYRLIYYDLNEKKILHEEFEESDMFGGSYEYFSFYQYNGNWWFFRPYCNDVYKVGIDKFEISYTWDFGKFNLDHKKVHFSEQAKNNVYKLYDELKEKFTYRFSEIGENNRYVIAHAKIKGEFANLIYDKSIQQSRYIDKFTESVIMCPMIVTNEYLLDFCNPGELEEHLTENMLGETNKKIFNDLIHSGDANPIIIKFNFK
ncbi:MAG: 6-bladed beta-propeller, partial [Candidatus Symbiothrix sp.]|nr:6-bladed beta-propeller [Candidatus Symbiothrix sp.]